VKIDFTTGLLWRNTSAALAHTNKLADSVVEKRTFVAARSKSDEVQVQTLRSLRTSGVFNSATSLSG
jgi:hypothetical protein